MACRETLDQTFILKDPQEGNNLIHSVTDVTVAPNNPSHLTGANVNSIKFHETALHHAARAHMVDLIELLVEFGANVFSSDNLGKTPGDYTTPGSPSYSCLQFYERNFLLCFSVSSNKLSKSGN